MTDRQRSKRNTALRMARRYLIDALERHGDLEPPDNTSVAHYDWALDSFQINQAIAAIEKVRGVRQEVESDD